MLDARRNPFNGNLTLSQLRQQELSLVVEMYRMRGGGWEPGMNGRIQHAWPRDRERHFRPWVGEVYRRLFVDDTGG